MQAQPGPAHCHASGMARSWTMPDRTGPAPAQKIRRPLRAKMPVSLTGPRAFSFSFQRTPVQKKAALRRACRSLSTEAAAAHRGSSSAPHNNPRHPSDTAPHDNPRNHTDTASHDTPRNQTDTASHDNPRNQTETASHDNPRNNAGTAPMSGPAMQPGKASHGHESGSL